MSAAPTVIGSASVQNQPPRSRKSINHKYPPTAAKAQGTKMTGWGLRNQNGSTSITYSAANAPITNPDQNNC